MGIFRPIANMGDAWVLVIDLLCILIAGILGTIIIVKLLRKVLKKNDSIDNAIITFIVNATKVACVTVIIAIILQTCGVASSTIVAVLGAAGATIALALKDSLANVAGGIMIIITHPFVQGDIVKIGNERGVVERIDLFLTTIRTLDYQTVTIPNGTINTSVVYNETNRDTRRVDCEFTISYESDTAKAKEVISRICSESELILDEPKPVIGVNKHLDSGLAVDCLAYCRQGSQWEVRYYLNEKVKEEFEREGIEIPYPHVDVNINK